MICSNCKKEIPDDTVLCPYCSYNVTEYDKRESVLSIIKKRANSNNTTGSKPVSHSFKVFIRTLIIVLVIQLFIFLRLNIKNKTYIEYNGYLVDYEVRDGKYTGVYEYEKKSETLRATYTTYYDKKEDVPAEIIIAERNLDEKHILIEMITFMLLPVVVLIVVAIIVKF